MERTQKALRRRLLAAILPHIGEGWTAAALQKAADEAGLTPDELRQACPGISDLVVFFCTEGDARMQAAMKARPVEDSLTARVGEAVFLRLEADAEHRKAARAAALFCAAPQNAATGLRVLAQTVDAIWRAAGDRATDTSYYTKRMLLAPVFLRALALWLREEDPKRTETRAAIAQGLKQTVALGGVARTIGEALTRGMGDALKSAAQMRYGPKDAPPKEPPKDPSL